MLIAVTRGRVVGAATTSDGTASPAETPSPVIQFPQCENETIGGELQHVGDSYCDTHANNVAECGFDGGKPFLGRVGPGRVGSCQVDTVSSILGRVGLGMVGSGELRSLMGRVWSGWIGSGPVRVTVGFG